MLSGLFGSVNGQSTVRNWSINRLANIKTFVASNTNTGTGSRAGANDWNGTFQAYGASPNVLPGEIFTFQGDTSVDTLATSHRVSGSAIVDQLALTINWENQDIISYAVNFSGHGALTEAAGFGTDATYPDAPPSQTAVVTLDAATISDLTQLVLTMTAANKAIVNSSTVEDGKVWTKRSPGPRVWTCAITRHNPSGLGPLAIHADVELVITIGSAVWDLKHGMLGDRSNLTVSPETGDIIAVTDNLTMNVAPLGGSAIDIPSTPAGLYLP